jgi:hypothetical protein
VKSNQDVSQAIILFFFTHQWLYSPSLGPGLFFSFVIIFTQTVGLLGRVIGPSQGRYLHTGQHKHRINAYTDIHVLSGIRTHDPSVRASEDSSYLRRRGNCDRLFKLSSEHISERTKENLEHVGKDNLSVRRETSIFFNDAVLNFTYRCSSNWNVNMI